MTRKVIYNDALWEKIFFRLAKGENKEQIARDLELNPVYLRDKIREFKKMSNTEFKSIYDRITQW